MTDFILFIVSINEMMFFLEIMVLLASMIITWVMY